MLHQQMRRGQGAQFGVRRLRRRFGSQLNNDDRGVSKAAASLRFAAALQILRLRGLRR